MTTVTSYIVLALTFFVSAHAAGWTYKDTAKWSGKYKACDGMAQSPIHVISEKAKYEATLDAFKLTGYETSMKHDIVNNGHTIQLNINYKAIAEKGGLPGPYKALQLHFHWAVNSTSSGSEHMLDSKAYPLEVHIVHQNLAYPNVTEALKHSDGLAVLGFFFEVGKRNPAMDKFLSNIPAIDAYAQSEAFSLSELLGSLNGLEGFFRYLGSLTTPPCSEAVVWTLFDKHLTISQDQLEALWNVKDDHGHQIANFRPIQDFNGRDIFTSVAKASGMMTTALSVLVFFSAFFSANLW